MTWNKRVRITEHVYAKRDPDGYTTAEAISIQSMNVSLIRKLKLQKAMAKRNRCSAFSQGPDIHITWYI